MISSGLRIWIWTPAGARVDI